MLSNRLKQSKYLSKAYEAAYNNSETFKRLVDTMEADKQFHLVLDPCRKIELGSTNPVGLTSPLVVKGTSSVSIAPGTHLSTAMKEVDAMAAKKSSSHQSLPYVFGVHVQLAETARKSRESNEYEPLSNLGENVETIIHEVILHAWKLYIRVNTKELNHEDARLALLDKWDERTLTGDLSGAEHHRDMLFQQGGGAAYFKAVQEASSNLKASGESALGYAEVLGLDTTAKNQMMRSAQEDIEAANLILDQYRDGIKVEARRFKKAQVMQQSQSSSNCAAPTPAAEPLEQYADETDYKRVRKERPKPKDDVSAFFGMSKKVAEPKKSKKSKKKKKKKRKDRSSTKSREHSSHDDSYSRKKSSSSKNTHKRQRHYQDRERPRREPSTRELPSSSATNQDSFTTMRRAHDARESAARAAKESISAPDTSHKRKGPPM